MVGAARASFGCNHDFDSAIVAAPLLRVIAADGAVLAEPGQSRRGGCDSALVENMRGIGGSLAREDQVVGKAGAEPLSNRHVVGMPLYDNIKVWLIF